VSGTVIEQLTTKLGLDVSDFKKGIGEAKKSMDDLKGGADEAGSAIGGMVGGGVKKATGSLGLLGSVLGKGGAVGLGIGAAIYLGKKLDDTLFKVALSVRQVSIESKNLNKSAADLRNLQNASAMAGGGIEDAAQSVGDLQKSLFNLRFNGQVSDQIVMLSRLGVQFQDSYGRAREFNDVMLDTAAALEKAQSSGQMNRGEAFEFAQQAGFTGGMAQLVLSGRSGVQAELDKQRARTQINNDMATGAERWVRGSISLGQATEAELGNKSMGLVANARGAADETLEKAGTAAPEMLRKAFDMVAEAAHSAANTLSKIGNLIPLSSSSPIAPGAAGSFSAANREAMFQPYVRAAAAKYGVREDVLNGILRTESGFNPDAVNKKTGAAGIAQIMPATGEELGVKPGKNPIDDIDASARYLRRLHDLSARYIGYDQGEDMPWVMAASAYHAGMGNVRSGKNIGPESLAYPGQVMRGIPGLEEAARGFRPGSDGGTITNEVQIDQITVHTQATDAEGIAGSLSDATRRKLLAAQAETGIQ
jgi:soluble lytic murein transglycosylase-like protein